ncbi:hypothetical protein DMENIID0001_148010 [Sergentomyia squamirostris]
MREESDQEEVILRPKNTMMSFEANLANEKLNDRFWMKNNLTDDDTAHIKRSYNQIGTIIDFNRSHSVGHTMGIQRPVTYIPYRQDEVFKDLQQNSFIHSNLAREMVRKSMPEEKHKGGGVSIGSVFKRDSFLRQSLSTILRRNKFQRRKSLSTNDVSRMKRKKEKKSALPEDKGQSSTNNDDGSSDSGAFMRSKSMKNGHKRSSSSSSCMSNR